MIVTWVTLNEVNDSVVEYGQLDSLDRRATGYVSVFQDSGSEKRREYIHRVVLRELLPGQHYCTNNEMQFIRSISFRSSLSLRQRRVRLVALVLVHGHAK